MGDYRILSILGSDSGHPGAMVMVLDVGFHSAAEALKHVKKSGDQFSRMQLMIVKACEIVAVQVQTTAVVEISTKPRRGQ